MDEAEMGLHRLDVLRGLTVLPSSYVGAQRGSEDGDSTSEARLERGENALVMGDDGDGGGRSGLGSSSAGGIRVSEECGLATWHFRVNKSEQGPKSTV